MDEKEPSRTDCRFEEIELAQALETFRSLLNLVVTTFSILVAADVALVGYAIANQRALIIGIGAVFPLVGLVMLAFFGRLVVPVVYTGLSIESRAKDSRDMFFWSMLSVMAWPSISGYLHIMAIPDSEERSKSLRRLRGYMPLGNITIWGLLACAGIQMMAVPVLTIAFSWSLI